MSESVLGFLRSLHLGPRKAVPIKAVSIYVFHDKAYLPTEATTAEGHVYYGVDPFHTAALDLQGLLQAVGDKMALGTPLVPPPTGEQLRERAKAVLRVTKARSWKQLAREGATYSINWLEDKITLTMYRLDEKGRWVTDVARSKDFPPDVSLLPVVQAILDDIRSRPGLLSPHSPQK